MVLGSTFMGVHRPALRIPLLSHLIPRSLDHWITLFPEFLEFPGAFRSIANVEKTRAATVRKVKVKAKVENDQATSALASTSG
jgi:hypothetical protein